MQLRPLQTSLYALSTLLELQSVLCSRPRMSHVWSCTHFRINMHLRFHTVMSHSNRMFNIGIQIDFEGVLLLMWGATIPLIYYGFYCDPTLQKVYWSLLSAFALACSIFTFQPKFRDPHLRPLRAATFGSFAFSSIIPVVHAAAKYGWAEQSQRMGLYWVIGTLAFNTSGAVAYAVKVGMLPHNTFKKSALTVKQFPEKWFKRRFDIFGASHQILHLLVICAGLTHTFGLLQAFDYLHDHGNMCP